MFGLKEKSKVMISSDRILCGHADVEPFWPFWFPQPGVNVGAPSSPEGSTAPSSFSKYNHSLLGYTALHLACLSGHVGVVGLLLSRWQSHSTHWSGHRVSLGFFHTTKVLIAGRRSCWRTRTHAAEPLCTWPPPMATMRCVSSSSARSSTIVGWLQLQTPSSFHIFS